MTTDTKIAGEDMTDAENAFERFAAQYHHESNEWLDMDIQETFIAGFEACRALLASEQAVPAQDETEDGELIADLIEQNRTLRARLAAPASPSGEDAAEQADAPMAETSPRLCGSCGNYVAIDGDHEEWCSYLGWKKRALEAEELNRKFMASVNGPTYMGEPATPRAAEQADEAVTLPEPFKSPLTSFGMLVRALRIVAGTTLYDMAEALSSTPATLSAVECGRKPLTEERVIDTYVFFTKLGVLDTLHALNAARAKDSK